MEVRSAIRQLGQHIKLDLSIAPLKTCRLVFDETLIVDIDWPDGATDRVVFSSAVGLVPASRKIETYELLLSANAYGRDTGDATLGVEPGHDEIVLHRALALDTMEFAAFVRALEEFLAQARAWTQRIETLKQSPAKSAGDETYNTGFIRA